jgi:hypothetical protein
MPSFRILEKEEAVKLSPSECFCLVGKPYSQVLEHKIMEQVVNKNYRIIQASYGDPLMKHHRAMATLKYLDELNEIKKTFIFI